MRLRIAVVMAALALVVILTQSLAIIDYLDETRPGPALLPPDPAGRARVRALSQAIACEMHPLANLRVLKRVETLAGSEARAAWNRDTIAAGLKAVEALLQDQRDLVRELLGTNRHLVAALRDALLEHHELVGTEITLVLEAAAAGPIPVA